MTFKGVIALITNLPSSANTIGDFYFVTEVTKFYLWNGTNWSYQQSNSDSAADTAFAPSGSIEAINVQNAIQELDSEKTSKDSPTLTGVPNAPTADVATNTTQLATTAFVHLLMAAFVDSAPATLDTLNELAAALGDDPNFAMTVTNTLASKSKLSTILSKTLATATWVADGSYWKYAIPITEAEAGLISSATKIELVPLERSTFADAATFKVYLDLIQNANIQGESITATSGGTGYVNIISMGTKPASDVTITVIVRGD